MNIGSAEMLMRLERTDPAGDRRTRERRAQRDRVAMMTVLEVVIGAQPQPVDQCPRIVDGRAAIACRDTYRLSDGPPPRLVTADRDDPAPIEEVQDTGSFDQTYTW
jgi:hypothetical protein